MIDPANWLLQRIFLLHIYLYNCCVPGFSAPQEIDEYELVDPVDILTPLDKSGFWDGVVSVISLS